MAKVNVRKATNQDATLENVAAPAPTHDPKQPASSLTGTVTSSTGTVIEFKIVTALEQMRLLRVVGADGENGAWMKFVNLASMVRKINGDPVPFPRTVAEIEMIIQRIENEGIVALTNGIVDTVQGKALDQTGTEQARNLS